MLLNYNEPANRVRDTLHLFILFALTFTQPLFELLARNAEFFVIRGSGSLDVVILVSFFSLAPGLFVLLLSIAERVRRHSWRLGHSSLMILILAALVLIAENRIFRPPWFLALSIAISTGCLLFAGYARYTSVRSFFTFLVPTLLIVPGLFLMSQPITKMILGQQTTSTHIQIHSSTPVVLVIFDELPLSSMLQDQSTLDAKRFPNFARLAQESTWYRNGTTVSEVTYSAVPAILSATVPRPNTLPIITDYPQNLFTLLGTSYELKVFEGGEDLLPTGFQRLGDQPGLRTRLNSMLLDLSLLYLHLLMPADLAQRWLPPVDATWGDFWERRQGGRTRKTDRITVFREFIESIGPTKKPTLFYIHSLLPHQPWIYLPDGKEFRCAQGPENLGYHWKFHCHLLQSMLVDRLLGDLMEKLKTSQLFDECLFIVIADHGTNFRGDERSRAFRSKNYSDIMLVPFFIKLPHQKNGAVNDLNVQSIDILPTIAGQLQAKAPWAEGLSVLDPAIKKRTDKVVFSSSSGEILRFGPVIRADMDTIKAREAYLRADGM